MKDMMQYKGYYGSVHYNDEDQVFFGKVEHIKSLISYEGDTARTIKKAFEEAVDDYLETCHPEGRLPEKPYKGSFNVRVGPVLHRQAALYAHEHHTNINSIITHALNEYLVSHRAHFDNSHLFH